MTKNLLTFLSHKFCIHCCGDTKKLECDSKNATCTKLASFRMCCNLYKEEFNEEEQRKQREEYAEMMMGIHCNAHHIDSPNHIIKDALRIAYDEGYRQAMENLTNIKK